MARREDEAQKRVLQIELQGWLKETGQKLVVVFEGRDAAGKGGTIKRLNEHLDPRGACVVAVDKPSAFDRVRLRKLSPTTSPAVRGSRARRTHGAGTDGRCPRARRPQGADDRQRARVPVLGSPLPPTGRHRR